jgi:hypothetical protein
MEDSSMALAQFDIDEEIDREIDRLQRVGPRLRDLGDVADCDRRLAALARRRAALKGTR